MARLNIPAFPVHKNTFQGTASGLSMDDKPYKIIHADEEVTINVTFEGGETEDYTLTIGEDITIATAESITSSGSVKVS